MKYKIEPKFKKSIEEHIIWYNSELDLEIRIIIGWRWGAVILDTEENPNELFNNIESGVDVYALGAELDYLDDGIFTSFEFEGEVTDEQKEEFEQLWYDESYSGYEERDFVIEDTELWFYEDVIITNFEE